MTHAISRSLTGAILCSPLMVLTFLPFWHLSAGCQRNMTQKARDTHYQHLMYDNPHINMRTTRPPSVPILICTSGIVKLTAKLDQLYATVIHMYLKAYCTMCTTLKMKLQLMEIRVGSYQGMYCKSHKELSKLQATGKMASYKWLGRWDEITVWPGKWVQNSFAPLQCFAKPALWFCILFTCMHAWWYCLYADYKTYALCICWAVYFVLQ